MIFPPINPPPPTWIDGFGNVLLIAAGVTLFIFMLAYGFLAAWRKFPAGRAIMYFVSGLSLLLGHYILSRFAGGDYLFRDLVRAAVYGFLFLVTLRLLVTFLVTWFRGNKEGQEVTHRDFLPPWRERLLERQEQRRVHRAERRALRTRQRRERWGSSDDRAVAEAADEHAEAR